VVKRRFAHIPNGRLVTIADAGHMLHHDQPAAVAAAMEEFLSEPE
jgi:pimeloyl-ACP methyl ester carboxylesterase